MMETITLAGTGVILGVLFVAAAARLVKSVFPPTADPTGGILMVAPMDPLTLALVIGMMLGVATLAAYVPARRAWRIDPTVALRYE
jgi:ABC-type lipoprotein release transport system permease subunit